MNNNGECDCTNEEYDGMVQCNIKLSLENDELRNILEKMGTNPNEILYLKNEVDDLKDDSRVLKEFSAWIVNRHEPDLFHKMEIIDKLKELKEGDE